MLGVFGLGITAARFALYYIFLSLRFLTLSLIALLCSSASEVRVNTKHKY